MSRSRIGSISFVRTDEQGIPVYKVEVQVGNKGDRKRACRYVHGSEREANLLAAALRSHLDGSASPLPEITVSEYFNSIFIPNLMSRGRAKKTIVTYRKPFLKWIEPAHGDRLISSISRQDVKGLVQSSTDQVNLLKTYRAILNSAFDDGFLSNPLPLKNIPAKHLKSIKRHAWSVHETMAAAQALRGVEMAELIFYIGISGTRREELLAVTPADLKASAKEDGSGLIAISISRAYTDEDGVKETKTRESVRLAPTLKMFNERLVELVKETMPRITSLDGDTQLIEFFNGWVRKRHASYRKVLFEGTEQEAEAELERIIKTQGALLGNIAKDQKIIKVDSRRWIIKQYAGNTGSLEKTWRKEVFDGSAKEAEVYASEEWRKSRLFPCSGQFLYLQWKNALNAAGLRYIPPSELRHTSESLQLAANVPNTAVMKIHGHSEFRTDYKYYANLVPEMVVDTAERVDQYLKTASSTKEIKFEALEF